VVGRVDRHSGVAEVANEASCEREHVGDSLVLSRAVPDENDRCRPTVVRGGPDDARHEFAIRRHVESTLNNAVVSGLADDSHGSEQTTGSA
jgi:hypothetical protein